MPVLVLAVWAIGFLATLDETRRVRESALASFTVVAVLVLLLSECLSLVHALTACGLGLSWGVVLLAGAALLHKRVASGAQVLRSSGRVLQDRADYCVAAALGLLGLGTLTVALVYPSVNWDSLSYHMTRVLFWIENRSVAYYPTVDGRQLFSSVMVDYSLMQLRLLSGGSDRLANVPQWLAYVFSGVTVSLIARELGAERRGQQVAALAAMTIPMAVLQASTTQNDLTVALWCAVTVFCGVRLVNLARVSETGAPSPWLAVWAGSAAGLATNSKAIAYVALSTFALWLVIGLLRHAGLKRSASLVLTIVVCFLALNSFWYTRNARTLDGDVLAARAPTMSHVLTKARAASPIATTALKNLAMLVGTRSDRVNAVIVGATRAIVSAYGGDIDDPLTIEHGQGEFLLPNAFTHDTVPAPMTVVLVALSAVVVTVHPSAAERRAAAYALSGIASLLLVAGLVTYNQFVNRILLVPMLLLTPIVGVAATMLSRQRGCASDAVVAGAMSAVTLAAMWALCVNPLTPLAGALPDAVRPAGVPPLKGYEQMKYVLIPELEGATQAVLQAVEAEDIDRIGVTHGIGYPIYPLLEPLADRHLTYVAPTLLPETIPPTESHPQAILEVVRNDEYPAVLADGRERGEMLIDPARTWFGTVLFYRAP